MKIEIQLTEPLKASEVVLRAILFNDSYEPVTISRNAFVGPNVRAIAPVGFPQPDSVEATFGQAEEMVTLQPFTFYGRERSFNNLAAGEIEVSAVYHAMGGQTEIATSRRVRVQAG